MTCLIVGAALPAGAAVDTYTITSEAPADGIVGVPYTHTFDAAPAGATWSVDATLPPGLDLGAGTGVITGTPTTDGTFGPFLVTAQWAVPLAVTKVEAGAEHTCALLDDGTVRCWGRNDEGQLGQGDIERRGDAVGEMGDALPAIDLGTGRTATAISVGGYHSCALLDDATVKCWGFNSQGQLGQGDAASHGDDAGEMGNDLTAIPLGTGRTATAIAASKNHTCALLDDATVKCWGYNGFGNLGLGDTTFRGDGAGEMGDDLPAIDLGTGRTATAIAAGMHHTCAVLDDATVKCWGRNTYGQLGQGDTAHRGDASGEMGDALPAIPLGTGRTATTISGGEGHTCALLDDATAKCWGGNNFGELGQESIGWWGESPGDMGDSLPPIDLGTGRTATAIEAGGYHTCAVLDDTTTKCWGSSSDGQLGLGDTVTRGSDYGEMGDALPVVDLGTGRVPVAITSRWLHTCVLLDDATVTCWGKNDVGQLGFEDIVQRGDDPGEMGDALPVVDLGTSEVSDTQAFTLTIHEPGTVSGTVVEDGTGTPLAGISVRLFDATSGTLLAVDATDLAGDYAFGSLAAGDYLLRYVDMDGAHLPEFHSDVATKPAATSVPVTAGGTTDVDASLAPAATGTIGGAVTEQGTGTPLAGISVRLLTTGNVLLAGRTTTASGSYSFGLRNHGSYVVRFIDLDDSHLDEYHLDAPTRAAATVVIHAAWITTIDAALAPST